MAEKIFNTRIINKHDTEANWNKATNFIPKQGELIIYDTDENNAKIRFKIGDGLTTVNELPFVVDGIAANWNQNDETALNYIQNRTHWEEGTYILPETKVDIKSIYRKNLSLQNTIDFIDGNIYDVIYNGKTYSIPTKFATNYYHFETVDFHILIANEQKVLQIMAYDGSSTVTLSIFENVEGISTELFPETTTTLSAIGARAGILPEHLTNKIIVGETYNIHYNGFSCDVVAESNNSQIQLLDPDNTFAILIDTTEVQLPQITVLSSVTEANISIFSGEIHKLDNKYIDQRIVTKEIEKLNLQNGEAFSSVRSKISMTENDSYKLGAGAVALGSNSKATGISGVSMGSSTNAAGAQSVAIGNSSVASGNQSFAGGAMTEAIGAQSVAIGEKIAATGVDSVAFGRGNKISITVSGDANATTYNCSSTSQLAEKMCVIYGDIRAQITAVNTSSGTITLDKTLSSTVLTNASVNIITSGAFGNYSFSGGDNSRATYEAAFAFGYSNEASGYASFAAGGSNKATHVMSTALGSSNTVSGYASFAAGNYNKVTNQMSTAFGGNNEVDGLQSFAAGYGNTASGVQSVALGNDTEAAGPQSMAMGESTVASGHGSAAIGHEIVAVGDFSFAEGGNYDHTNDKNRILSLTITGDAKATTYTCTSVTNLTTNHYVFIDSKFAKITSIDTTNNTITLENTLSDTALSSVEAKAAKYGAFGKYSHSGGNKSIAIGTNAFTHGENVKAIGNYSIAMGAGIAASGDNSVAFGGGTTASGTQSFAHGGGSQASGNQSFAMGGGAQAIGSQAVAFGSGTTASGVQSFAMGGGTTASGTQSLAHGSGSQASGYQSFAMGGSARANGDNTFAFGAGVCAGETSNDNYAIAMGGGSQAKKSYSVAIGSSPSANAQNSFALGTGVQSNGDYSFALGNNTIANGKGQFVIGEYNATETVEDNTQRGTYAFLVGNGEQNAPSNAFTLDWNGNGWFKDGIKIGGTSQDDAAALSVLTSADIESITEDYTELAEDVGQLSEEIADVKDTLGCKESYKTPSGFYDLPNKNKGLNDSGGLVDNAYYDSSDYIEVKKIYGICRVPYNNTKYSMSGIAFYDANKNFIQYISLGTDYEFDNFNQRTVVWYPINRDAVYLRFAHERSRGNIWVVEKEFVASIFDGYTTKEEHEQTVRKLDSLFATPFLFKKGMECENSLYIDESGNRVTSSNYDTSMFLPVDNGSTYVLTNVRTVNFYGSEKNWLSGMDTRSSENANYDLTIDDENTKYIRVSCWNDLAMNVYGVVLKNAEFDVVNFGDSIFGQYPTCSDISTKAQEKTQIKFANCAFGGTTTSSREGDYNAFSFYSLCDAIYAEDFSAQIEKGNLSSFYRYHTNTLASVDFSKVKVITIAYGTNDWNFGNDIDNESDKYDVATYCGALRYGIEKILAKYPHIQICLMSPIFRMLENGDSDSIANSKGKYLKDFCDAMKMVAQEYHLPFFDHYNIGINKFNHTVYLKDKTHPTYTDGIDLLGTIVGEEVKSIIRD